MLQKNHDIYLKFDQSLKNVTLSNLIQELHSNMTYVLVLVSQSSTAKSSFKEKTTPSFISYFPHLKICIVENFVLGMLTTGQIKSTF